MPNITSISFHAKDSLLEQIDSVNYEASIVHDLKIIPLSVNSHLKGELIYTIIFIIVFAFIRLRGKKIFQHLLNLVINRKKTENIFNEGVSSYLFYYVLSLLLSLSIISGCISTVICDSFLSIYTLYAFIALLLYHFILLAVIHLLAWTFNSMSIANEATVTLWTYHIIIGLAISPFVLSSLFVQNFAVESLLKITVFSLALLLIVKFARWIEILFTHRVSILYMILYLCTFEIIPLLVLYKIVA